MLTHMVVWPDLEADRYIHFRHNHSYFTVQSTVCLHYRKVIFMVKRFCSFAENINIDTTKILVDLNLTYLLSLYRLHFQSNWSPTAVWSCTSHPWCPVRHEELHSCTDSPWCWELWKCDAIPLASMTLCSRDVSWWRCSLPSWKCGQPTPTIYCLRCSSSHLM